MNLRSMPAILGAIALCMSGCSNREGGNSAAESLPSLEEVALPGQKEASGLRLQNFSSCQAIEENVREQLLIYQDHLSNQPLESHDPKQTLEPDIAVADDAEIIGPTRSTVDEFSDQTFGADFTNVQEKGLDEPDLIKIGATHIYVRNPGGIQVVDRSTLLDLGLLPISNLDRLQLFVDESRLIVIGIAQVDQANCHQVDPVIIPDYLDMGEYSEAQGDGGLVEKCWKSRRPETQVLVFEGASGALPQLTRQRALPYSYKHVRFINGYLLFAFAATLPWADTAHPEEKCGSDLLCYEDFYNTARDQRELNVPAFLQPGQQLPEKLIAIEPEETIEGVSCSQVAEPLAGDLDFRLSLMISMNTRDDQLSDRRAAVLGGGDDMYMTSSSIYLTKHGFKWMRPEDKTPGVQETLIISKFDFDADSGAVIPAAVGAVRGEIKDQWAFKEHPNDILSVATTTEQPLTSAGSEPGQRNHLWVMQQDGDFLLRRNAVLDFGVRENIRAIRHVGDMVYIVTFRRTDPLFAIDLSDPLDPRVIGQLKVPGFSAYLHPTRQGQLVGVGFQADEARGITQGLQVSLFDVTNPESLNLLNSHQLGERGSFSDVVFDHKAFFFDAESQMAGIPVISVNRSNSNRALLPEFNGAILYHNTGLALDEVARFSHGEWIPEACHWLKDNQSLDINRLYKVDERLVTVSRYGIKAYAWGAWGKPVAATQFDTERQHNCLPRQQIIPRD